MDPRDPAPVPTAPLASESAATQLARPAATPRAAAATPPEVPVGVPGDPLVGTLVAERYRLTAKIGEGGMGAVYRGEHVALRKAVAVKFLHRELTTQREYAARFEREALAAAHLNHPNVAAATDFGKLPDGTHFLVMEFIEGQALRALLRAAPTGLPPGRALRILEQIGAALARAHGAGIVHRDLKPENVIVCDRDDAVDLVKVIDFGIARVSSSEFGGGGTALTQIGSVFGTPQYMSPEQALGQRVDAAADQYALGVMAFELFSGRLPFIADDAVGTLGMHVGAPVPMLGSVVPGAPPELSATLAKMLAKRPADRFASVAAAIEAIGASMRASAPAAAPVALPVSAHGSAVAPPAPAGAAAMAALAGAPTQPLIHAGLGSAVAPIASWNQIPLGTTAESRRPPLALLAALGVVALLGVIAVATMVARSSAAPSVTAGSVGASTPAAVARAASAAGSHPGAAVPDGLARAREHLAGAESCEELGAALGELASLGAAGDDTMRSIRDGDCGALRHPELCAECVVRSLDEEVDESEERGTEQGHGHGHGHGHRK